MGCLVKRIRPSILRVSLLSFLSTRLRRLRMERELSQEEFAEKAGISYKFYQAIESGRKKQIWLETVERLAAAHGLEPWQLLAPEVPPNNISASRSAAAPKKSIVQSSVKRSGRVLK